MSKKSLSINLINVIALTVKSWLAQAKENPRTYGPPATLGSMVSDLVAREFSQARRDAYRDGVHLGLDLSNLDIEDSEFENLIEKKVDEYENLAAVDRGDQGGSKSVRPVGVRKSDADGTPLFEYRGDSDDFESF